MVIESHKAALIKELLKDSAISSQLAEAAVTASLSIDDKNPGNDLRDAVAIAKAAQAYIESPHHPIGRIAHFMPILSPQQAAHMAAMHAAEKTLADPAYANLAPDHNLPKLVQLAETIARRPAR